jgi:hypothetical protein
MLDRFENFGTSAEHVGRANIPIAGNFLASKQYQQFAQAEKAFINAHLRRDSGAAIQDHEFERYRKEYIPVPGDSPDVLEQKRDARRRAVKDMMAGGGRGYRPPAGWENPETAGGRTPAEPLTERKRTTEREKRRATGQIMRPGDVREFGNGVTIRRLD